ncbi:MAG: hypothetical protein HOH38_03415 [Nitrospinaceae bacterium]|nr:hypothetical protein [Nitrospinaceae bacterium]
MKTKLTERFSKLIAILAFLSISAGNAFAVTNSSTVVSPYWQSDSGSYTFIAVSHTSLSGMASQIGLTVNAISNDGTAFASAVDFTIDAGSTTRVFIVRTNQSTVNSTSISSAQFIVGTTNFEHGFIRVDPIATSPTTSTGNLPLEGDGFRDVTMLSFWGTVVVEQNTTGFAMEFIGDMHDSSAAPGFDSVDGTGGMDVGGPAAP